MRFGLVNVESLKEIRKKINVLDNEIIGAFQKRMDLIEIVADIKKQEGLEIEDEDREKEIIDKLKLEEYGNQLSILYEKVFEITKEYQKNYIMNKSNKS